MSMKNTTKQKPEPNLNINSASTLDLIAEQWYPICLSASLKNKPQSLRRLGQDLVLWRDESGAACCAPAACPHRGADLGMGRIEKGELQCKYHGFCFDRNGRCTKTPCEGSRAEIPNSLDLQMIPVEEKDDFIWFYYGKNKNRPQIPHIKGITAGWRDALTCEFTWDISLSRVMEGMMDLHHLPFAHRPWFPPGWTRLDPYKVRVEDGVIYTRGILRKEEEKGGIKAFMNVGFPSLLHIAMGNGADIDDDTISGFEMLGTCTPIDQHRTWIAVYYRQSYVRIPLFDRLFNLIALQFDLKLIQPDDYRLLKSSRPSSSGSGSSHLVRADRGIAEWHRLQKKALESNCLQDAETEIQKTG